MRLEKCLNWRLVFGAQSLIRGGFNSCRRVEELFGLGCWGIELISVNVRRDDGRYLWGVRKRLQKKNAPLRERF